MIGVGISPFLRRKTTNGFSFGSVTQYLSGIVGNEMIDISGNGYNVDIINNDIVGSGFPYKSSALIAQKVANFGLIPDVNNFWFTSGGTPNQIPVVSLFQNIDYANQIFCKHQLQSLNTEGVEVSEPKVTEIVTYSAALTGSNLTSANSYFGVPSKNVALQFVDFVNGNDTTGTGTEALPWKTIIKGISSATTGFYVKSGEYDNGATARTTTKSIIGIGRVKVTNISNYAFNLNNHNLAIDRMWFDTSITAGGIFINTNVQGAIIKNCEFTGIRSFAIKSFGNNATVTVNNCVFNSDFTLGDAITIQASCTIINISDCLFAKSATTGIRLNANSTNIALSNNKITGTYNIFATTASLITAGTITDLGNNIAITGAYINLYDCGNVSIKYNTFTGNYTYFSTTLAAPANSTITVTNNNITSGLGLGSKIFSVFDKSVVFNNNTIECSIGSEANPLSINAINRTVTAQINYNYIKQKGNGAAFSIGLNETSNFNKISGTFIGNKILGPLYYGVISSSAHSTQILNNDNIDCKLNFVNGFPLGLVFKGYGLSTPATIGQFNILVNGLFYFKGVSDSKFNHNIVSIDTYDTRNIAIVDNGGNALNNELKYNVIINHLPSPGVNSPCIFLEHLGQTIISDYNRIYSTNGSIGRELTTNYNFIQWQAFGQDANSTNTDVTFNDNTLVELYDLLMASIGTETNDSNILPIWNSIVNDYIN